MLKMVDGTGIIGVDMICPLGGTVSPPQPPNYDKVEMEGVGSLMLPNSLKAPLERVELIGNSVQGENPAPDNPQEIKSAGKHDEVSGKYLFDVKVTGKNLLNLQKEPDVKGTYQGWKVGDGKKTIVLSIKDKGNNVDITKCSIGVSGNGINPNDGFGWIVQDGTILRSEIKTTNPYVTIYPPNETTVQKFLGRFEIQVEYGTTATPYEPYTEQILTLTSDRPLTKWDKLVEQDGQIGWLYKHKIIEDFSTLVKDSEPIYGKDGEKYFSVSLQGALFNYDYNKIYSVAGLCPKDSKIHYVPKPMIQSVVIYVSDTDTIMTAKEHMHYKVIYETTESQFAPLSESEQTQLRNLHSYNGTTHVFVDSGEVPCGIKLTYRKEI